VGVLFCDSHLSPRPARAARLTFVYRRCARRRRRAGSSPPPSRDPIADMRLDSAKSTDPRSHHTSEPTAEPGQRIRGDRFRRDRSEFWRPGVRRERVRQPDPTAGASSRTMYRLLDWFGRRMHVDGFDAVLSPQLQWRMPDGVITVLGGQTPGETAQRRRRQSGVSSTGTRSTRSGGGSVLPRPYYPDPRPFRSNKTTLYSLGVIHVALPA
jgi:hypothetical protein